jgi:D-glycero-alpha-D-manno-heptose 1-phosphate guanylyltransferase
VEAIILAGGAGTRLRSVVSDIPKPMAPVQGRPMLEWQLIHLRRQGIGRVVLSVGHLADVIVRHFGEHWEGLEIAYAVETVPLGTGGAIQFALQKIRGTECFVLNGDSLLDLDYAAMKRAHGAAHLTMALKRADDSGRYGCVVCDGARVSRFSPGQEKPEGAALINGGVYLTSPGLFGNRPVGAFSFERDFLPDLCVRGRVHHVICSGFFIDIGVPEDYSRAQSEPFFPSLLT